MLPKPQYPRVELVNGKSIHMALAAQNPIPKNHVRYCHCPTYERTSLISIPKRRVGQLKGIHNTHGCSKPNTQESCQILTLPYIWKDLEVIRPRTSDCTSKTQYQRVESVNGKGTHTPYPQTGTTCQIQYSRVASVTIPKSHVRCWVLTLSLTYYWQ